MKFKKVAALLLAGAMCAAAVVGCGKSEKDSTATDATKGENTTKEEQKTEAQTQDPAKEEAVSATITVWSPAEDQDETKGAWLQTRCEAFNAAHPNWDLKFEYATCGEDKAAETVGKDPEAAADVYMFANDQINKLIDAGAISRLGGTTEAYIKSTNSQAIVDSVTVDGAVYGIPYTTNTWALYYDKRTFSEEDVKSLDKMLEKGKVAFPLTDSWYIASFYVGNGCTFFEDSTKEDAGIDFEGDKATAVTNYLVDLVKNPNFVNDADGAGIAGLKAEGDKHIGAMFTGSWGYSNICEAIGKENVGVAKLPTYTLDGVDKQMYAFAGSKAVAVNKNAKEQKVCVALAQWLANEESQLTRYEARGVVPCNTALLETEKVKTDALCIATNEVFDKTSIMQPFVAKMGLYWTPAQNMGNAIVAGQVTHDTAAQDTADMNTAFNTEVIS